MQERFQLPVPMWRVHYQLLGGHRRVLTIAAVCMIVLVAGAFGFLQVMYGQTLTTVGGGLLSALAVIQIAVVVLGGCNAVHRAMLRDYDTKMIESHRLTPMSNVTVALGYLFGSTLQILVVFLVILTFGMGLTFLSGYPVVDWIYGNVFLLNGGVTLWAIVVLSGLHLRKPISPASILVAVAVMGNLSVLALPALGLLLCAYPVVIGFHVMTGGAGIAPAAIVILGAINLLMTVFWISAAAAKYRRPDLPALNAFRGLLLLAFWVVLGAGGIALVQYVPAVAMPFGRGRDVILAQWIATMILALVIALPAIAGAVECRMLGKRGSTPRGWSDRVPAVITALIAAALICGGMAGIGAPQWRTMVGERTAVDLWLYTTPACFLAMLTARAVFLAAYPMWKRPRTLGTILLFVIWAAPPLIDLVQAQATQDSYSHPVYSSLMGYSPAGTIVAVWSDVDVSVWPGLLAQALMAVALSVIAWLLMKRPRAPDPRPLTPP